MLHKVKQLFPWKNIVNALHTIVSSLSISEKEMNTLDLYQLRQCTGDLSNWWLSMFAIKIKFGRTGLGLFSKPGAGLGWVLGKGSSLRE